MAVYTEVSDRELNAFVARYDIGAVTACKGIAEGIENSNYLLQTDTGSYILTLYEKRVAEADLPFFLGLMEHLAARGVPCPVPVRARSGPSQGTLCKRPAAIVTFLSGMWPRSPSPAHCHELGAAMAAMHLAGADFAMTRPNDLSLDGWRRLAAAIGGDADRVGAGLAEEISEEIAWLTAAWPKDLPTGIVHADLFPDNVFFRDRTLTGLIDFYFACTDMLAYDIAVAVNAWCFAADGGFSAARSKRLIAGYDRVRNLTDGEKAALPALARGAALRFLLTRLQDWLSPPDPSLPRKDPLEFLNRLRFHQGVAGPEAYGLT